jgi:hypothetical protein
MDWAISKTLQSFYAYNVLQMTYMCPYYSHSLSVQPLAHQLIASPTDGLLLATTSTSTTNHETFATSVAFHSRNFQEQKFATRNGFIASEHPRSK